MDLPHELCYDNSTINEPRKHLTATGALAITAVLLGGTALCLPGILSHFCVRSAESRFIANPLRPKNSSSGFVLVHAKNPTNKIFLRDSGKRF